MFSVILRCRLLADQDSHFNTVASNICIDEQDYNNRVKPIFDAKRNEIIARRDLKNVVFVEKRIYMDDK